MAAPMARLRRRAWVERARIAGMAGRILEVDRVFWRCDGAGVLTEAEAQVLRRLAERLTAVEA